MILVVTGSGGYPFDRLLRKIEEIAPRFEVPFVVQNGPFPFPSRLCRAIGLVSYDKLMEYYRLADLVVAHTSSGPLIYAARFGKPIITLPRRTSEGEAVDDHQEETAVALRALQEPMRMTLDGVEGLEDAIRSLLEARARGLQYTTGKAELESLQGAIRACLP